MKKTLYNTIQNQKTESEKRLKIINKFKVENKPPNTLLCIHHNVYDVYDVDIDRVGNCSYYKLDVQCHLCCKQLELDELKRKLQIPPIYLNLIPFGKYRQLIHNGRGLYITGAHGTGKSRLLCEIALDNESDPVYNFQDVCAKFLSGEINNDYIIDQLRHCKVLFLDGLGEEVYDGYQYSIICNSLMRIVDYRWKYQKPIFITSNLNVEQVSARYSTALASRLFMRNAEYRGMLDILNL